jgi:hypothetical protein
MNKKEMMPLYQKVIDDLKILIDKGNYKTGTVCADDFGIHYPQAWKRKHRF